MTHEPFGAPAQTRDTSEERLQKALVQVLRLETDEDDIYFAIPNGAKRSKRTAAMLKATGVIAGVADMGFVLLGGRIAFMEIKRPRGHGRPKGRQSKEQRNFMDKCNRRGIPYALVYTLDQAILQLVEWEFLSPKALYHLGIGGRNYSLGDPEGRDD